MKILFFALICIGILPSAFGSSVGDSCQVARSGAQGICKVITDCQEVINDIVKKGLYPTQCGFRGREQIVCCPSTILLTTTTTPAPTRISQRSICFSFVFFMIFFFLYILRFCLPLMCVRVQSG